MEQFLTSAGPFILLLGVMYLFMIRPQLKRQKQERQFLSEIKKGSKVVMTSGIHGKIVDTNDSEGTIIVETQAGKLKFERSAISMDMTRRHQKEKSQTK